MQRFCEVVDCNRPVKAKGLCGSHYQRKYRTGNVNAGLPVGVGAGVQWIEDNINNAGEDCIIWPFNKSKKTGYGTLTAHYKNHLAHRYVCLMIHGQPPSKSHQAAHSCGNRLCVNPNHLRWATPIENTADKKTSRNPATRRRLLSSETIKCPSRRHQT